MIHVLVVDDSPMFSMLLRALIDKEPDMNVIGQACNGVEAVEMVKRFQPDLVTMDIRMPEMDGIEAIREIMASYPTPVIVISSTVTKKDYQSMNMGALLLIEKPESEEKEGVYSVRDELINNIRVLSKYDINKINSCIDQKSLFDIGEIARTAKSRAIELIAIGASTGGPKALLSLLADLPSNYAVPIIVNQHISQGFVEGLAGWLNDQLALQVKIVEQGELLQAGTVYLAPDDVHFEIERKGEVIHGKLTQSEPVNRFRPSASVSFMSVAQVCKNKAIGIILTGMGCDGAEGLQQMRSEGALTFAQDAASCVVHGMPAEAVALGAVEYEMGLMEISACIRGIIDDC